MKFRNPWIDPRIEQVRPEDAQVYLKRTGWKSVGLASDPALLRYERMDENPDAPTLFVPVRVQDGASLQWMIDLVADLARYEDRWAVEVLRDILLQPSETLPANGPPAKATVETAKQ